MLLQSKGQQCHSDRSQLEDVRLLNSFHYYSLKSSSPKAAAQMRGRHYFIAAGKVVGTNI